MSIFNSVVEATATEKALAVGVVGVLLGGVATAVAIRHNQKRQLYNQHLQHNKEINYVAHAVATAFDVNGGSREDLGAIVTGALQAARI